MSRRILSQFGRWAAGLAVAAAFVLGAAPAVAHSGHSHSVTAISSSSDHNQLHHQHDASRHYAVASAASNGADTANAHGSDAGCCVFCACCAVAALPRLTTQVTPFVLLRSTIATRVRHGDGIVPDGLRRPPRTIAIT